MAIPDTVQNSSHGGAAPRTRPHRVRFPFGRAGIVAVVALGGLALTGTTMVQASANFPSSLVSDYAGSLPAGSAGPNGGQCIALARWAADQAWLFEYRESLSFPATGAYNPATGEAYGYYNTWADVSASGFPYPISLWGYAQNPSQWQNALRYAQVGDIIQLSPDPAQQGGWGSDTGWINGSWQHTFILIWNYSGSSPESSTTPIVQSNWYGNGTISYGTVGGDLSWEATYHPGLMMAVWQFGY